MNAFPLVSTTVFLTILCHAFENSLIPRLVTVQSRFFEPQMETKNRPVRKIGSKITMLNLGKDSREQDSSLNLKSDF